MATFIDQTFLDETVQILQDYIRIDTTNPPGNEIEAARYLKGILEREGFEVHIEESAPGRANLWTYLRGKGNAKPVIFLNHMDVVPAETAKWSFPPFSGEVRGGYLYGRGTIDMKGMGILELMSLIYLKRQGILLDRDVLFLAVADEETGGTLGAKWILDRHPEFLDVEGVLNEGGGGVLQDDTCWYEVATSQKVICQIQLTARGEGGHASVPKEPSAVTRLLDALEKIRNHKFSPILISTVAEYYRRIAPMQPVSLRPVFEDMESAIQRGDPALQEIMQDPIHRTLTHHTAAMTVLRAGEKVNVIPTEATARVDCRLIPGTAPDDFTAFLKQLIEDPSVEVQATFKGIDAPPSSHETPFFRAIETAVGMHDPRRIITPHLVPGATDSRYFRAAGVNCYDFIPFRLTVEERMLIHGIDERISIDNLKFGVEVMVDILLNL